MKHIFESNGVIITIFAAKSEEFAIKKLKEKIIELKENHGVELPDFLTFKLKK